MWPSSRRIWPIANPRAVPARIDELVPEMVVSRLADGESPLRVGREYRGISQAAVARTANTSRG